MSKTQINLFQTIKETIPSFIREEFPLFGDLLEEYYISLERKSGVYDILNKIEQTIKLDNIFLAESFTNTTKLHYDYETEIEVESTIGFPEKNGLIQINDEIIFYKEKTDTSFLNCYRGFSGLNSFGKEINFASTSARDHVELSEVVNLYSLLVEQFLNQLKIQFLPGLENSEIITNQNLFIKQSSDFYRSKGSDESFRILFSALFGVPAKVIKPQDDVFEASKSFYSVTTDLLVEPIVGNIENCLNRTLYQYNEFGQLISGVVSKVEKINKNDKNYFILGIDFENGGDIFTRGSLYGIFDYSKRTKVLEDTYITPNNKFKSVYVDSTIGFPDFGLLQVNSSDGEIFDITYSDKNNNQFNLVTDNELFIPKNSYLTTKNFAFSYVENEVVEMRICPIFSNEYDLDDNSSNLDVGDPIIVSKLGETTLSNKFNDWIFNIRTKAVIKNIVVQDSILKKYRIEFYKDPLFYLNDKFELFSSDGKKYNLTLLSKVSNSAYDFSSETNITNTSIGGFHIERKLSKSSFTNDFDPDISSITNVQNVYCDNRKESVYIESGSIPNYGQELIDVISRKISFSGNYSSEINNYILYVGKHKFLTGDIVVYSEGDTNRLNISNGKYYVKVIDNENIKLAFSSSKLFANDFVKISGNITNNSLYLVSNDWLDSSNLSDYISNPNSFKIFHQKLIKKISNPSNSSTKFETTNGPIGIFKNGVELLSYKSLDCIFYGSIKNIEILSGGEEYDVINPPELVVSDGVLGAEYGTGAEGTLEVSGSLKRIDILNPGVGFYYEPSIKISGGNGFGAKVNPVFETKKYLVEFNSSSDVSIFDNEISYSEDVYFVDGEVVKYLSGSNSPIGGLSNNSFYYIRQINQNTIKLYPTYNDSLSNTNEINLTSTSSGIHSIVAVQNRKLITNFEILSEGFGYTSKKLVFNSSSVNIFNDTIEILNHNLSTGEIIVYFSNGTSIEGLTSGNKYYVYKIDDNKIKLSTTEINLSNNRFINLTSIGSGQHIIEYDPIQVQIINLDNNNNNTLEIRPIFRGSIIKVHMNAYGENYGSDEILNFNRQPEIYAETGSGCKVTPVIIQGKIEDFIIENSGINYNSIPDVNIIGSGSGAKIIPIINNGQISDFIIQNPGYGYDLNTTIEIIPAGSGSQFYAKIDKWTINLVEKELSKNLISNDDGFLYKGKYGLQYSYCYAPRSLRKYILSKRIESGVERYVPDLTINPIDGKEQNSQYHSPILGWAYDGNPIYGPYGFENSNGTGLIKRLKSGYKIVQKENRPTNLQQFPLGFFIDDYEYFDGSDLDEYNGRFCVTPEYPNGIYAYFCTVGDIDPQYQNYRKPVFPYVVGNFYKSDPIDFNFDINQSQDNFEIYNTLIKNTSPYNLFDEAFEYDGLDITSDIKNQTSYVYKTKSGKITGIATLTNGVDYKVQDPIILDSPFIRTQVKASVSSVEGSTIVSISQSSTQLNDVELIRYPYSIVSISTIPHNINYPETFIYDNKNYNEFYPNVSTLVLTNNLDNSSTTGITTYINVFGINDSKFIFENDIFYIENEKVKVLEVDAKSSRLKILREYDGTIGLAHSYGTILQEDSRKLYSPSEYGNTELKVRNRELYFNPSESVGLGSSKTVLTIENPSFYPNIISIDPGKIYLRNHFLQTNDIIRYSSIGNSPIIIEKNSQQISLPENEDLYVYRYSEDFIGIYDEPIYLNDSGEFIGTSRTPIELFKYVSNGSGNNHSFSLINTSFFTNLVSYNLEIETETNHLLNTGDFINLKINLNDTETIKIIYNEENRRFCANPVSFASTSVNIENNFIEIENHNFRINEKIIYTSSNPIVNLTNNGIYYINVIDKDKISFNDLNGNLVSLGSSSFGSILKINPKIEVERNKSITFDLSDSSLSHISNNVSYSSFDFNLYTDEKFTNKLISTKSSNLFNVEKIGKIGIDPDARLILSYDDNLPNIFYYKLESLKSAEIPDVKKELIIDDEQSIGTIEYKNSVYSGTYKIVKINDKKFRISLNDIPRNILNSNYSASYTTSSTNTSGPVHTVSFYSFGENFEKIPKIYASSEEGSGFVGFLKSNDIGKLNSIKLDDISIELPTDITITPKAFCPVLLKLDFLSSLESVEILDYGINYNQHPDLVLINGVTEKPVNEVIIKFNKNTSKLEILNNSNKIYNNPKLIPKNNSNGYKISSIIHDEFTNESTIILDTVGFTTSSDFPFQPGYKFMLEGIVTTDPSVDLGYNSENYNYKLYTVISSDPNIGGQSPSITFSMADFSGENHPGFYDPFFTSSRIIPESFFPKYNIILKENNFYADETITDGKFDGFVLKLDEVTGFLKITTKNPELIEKNSIVEGKSSHSFAKIIDIVGISTVSYRNSALRKSIGKWDNKKGFLNESSQRLHDSDYYQYFSYAINSTVELEKWDNLVQNTNHVAGFKRFSNLTVSSENSIDQSTISGDGSFIGISNIDSEVNLNCIYDYDLVSENNIIIDLNKNISDEIRFGSKLLQDYFESSGNRVLLVDDISDEFNSNPRPTRFSVADEFELEKYKFRKYFIFTSNKIFDSDRQSIIVNLLHDGTYGYLNQYGRVETYLPHGYFDFTIFNNYGYLLYYPVEYQFSDYNISGISLNIGEELVGIGTTNFGNIVSVASTNSIVPSGSPSGIPIKLLTHPISNRSTKYLVTVESSDGSFLQSNEFNVINDGSDVFCTEFGSLETSSFDQNVAIGFATYYPQLNGSNVDFYIVPNSNPSQNYKVNVVSTNISDNTSFAVGSKTLRTTKIETTHTSILSSPSTTAGIITSYSDSYNGFYILASIEDTTNNIFEFTELVAVRDNDNLHITNFGSVVTDSSVQSTGIGTFSGTVNISDETEIKFEPLPNIDVSVRCLIYAIELVDLLKETTSIELDEANIETLYGDYTGTDSDVKRTFDLTYKGLPIFERTFNSEDTSIVSVENSTIVIPNHFFVTGEKIKYSYDPYLLVPEEPIGIATTVISGVSTNKLPSDLYVVKISDSTLKFASSAENALRYNPITLEFSSVGIGSNHRFTSTRQNVKGLFTIDNMVQSPIQETEIKVELLNNLNATDNLIKLSGISSLFSNDLIKINDEVMLIETVGISSNELLRVRRRWMGSDVQTHGIGSTVTKIYGNYNIVGSTINFASAPYGKVPLSIPQNQLGAPYVRPDDRDFSGITTNSYFSGRVFLRSGEVDTSKEVYSDNYLFDNISDQFTGITSEFLLKENGNSIAGISSNNAIILIKDIFQKPERSGASAIVGNYRLYENSGDTFIQFNPSIQEVNDDINVTSLPLGGVIISIGSSLGFGYQPLVSAGGTAIISGFGTISQISIGNSGSGYRSGIQTNINVYAQTSTSTEKIGIATASDGHVTSISITNPGISYTSSNPPLIKFDEPLGYSNIPLVYSNDSIQGIGSGAKVDLVVSRDSSILQFNIINNGYQYKEGEILTVDIGGSSGIPTDVSKTLSEFQIKIDKIHNDEFSGWSVGDVQQLDPLDNLFNGTRRVFPLTYQGSRVSIIPKNGSNIDVESTLLIFINGILQSPGKSYTFNGGSLIVFSEAPKKEYNSNILFYRGTKDIDVKFVDIIEEVEPGDTVTIHSNISSQNEESRIIEEILSTDVVLTIPYSGPGLVNDETIQRPINICRQTEDLYINGIFVSKDRSLYEPIITPITNIIQSVGTSSTEIFVENLKTFFDNKSEDLSSIDLSQIEIISQNDLIAGIATATVSAAGSITAINLSNPGYGYTFNPSISIANPPEYSSDRINSTASLTVSNGSINSYTITNSGRGYDQNNPPVVLIEPPKPIKEEIINVTYEGDFGIVVGVSNTAVGSGVTALHLDLYIENQSFLRNELINSDLSNIGISGLSTSYFFSVNNSNIGYGPLTSLYNNEAKLSQCNIYFDNIFQVYSTEIISKNIAGIGTTSILRVTTLIEYPMNLTLSSFDSSLITFDDDITTFNNETTGQSYTDYYGDFSWGKITFDPDKGRTNKKEFVSYYENGSSGISTSALIKRKTKLKSKLYLNQI